MVRNGTISFLTLPRCKNQYLWGVSWCGVAAWDAVCKNCHRSYKPVWCLVWKGCCINYVYHINYMSLSTKVENGTAVNGVAKRLWKRTKATAVLVRSDKTRYITNRLNKVIAFWQKRTTTNYNNSRYYVYNSIHLMHKHK